MTPTNLRRKRRGKSNARMNSTRTGSSIFVEAAREVSRRKRNRNICRTKKTKEKEGKKRERRCNISQEVIPVISVPIASLQYCHFVLFHGPIRNRSVSVARWLMDSRTAPNCNCRCSWCIRIVRNRHAGILVSVYRVERPARVKRIPQQWYLCMRCHYHRIIENSCDFRSFKRIKND